MAAITELAIGDDADVWASLGFAVDGAGCVSSGVRHRLDPELGRGLRSWAVSGLDVADGSIDGIPTSADGARGADGSHPNGVVAIDHVVLGTPNLPRTMAALEATGLERRRVRDSAPGVQQAFYRLGDVILEVAGAVEPDPAFADRPARFFGIAYTVADLDATAAFLGDRLHPAKDAVQPGRRIATLDKGAGSSIAIAFMSAGPLEYE